jgi:hypothetical protein
MSVVAGDALAVLKGNLRAVHGDELVEELSEFALVDEVAEIDPGMMAVPPGRWLFVRQGTVTAVAAVPPAWHTIWMSEGIWKLRRLAASQPLLFVKPGNFGSSVPNAGP